MPFGLGARLSRPVNRGLAADLRLGTLFGRVNGLAQSCFTGMHHKCSTV